MKSTHFWLSKKVMVELSYSDAKPREWYSINKKSGFRERRYFSIEKHTKRDMMAYAICVGPFRITAGWLERE